MIFFMLLRIVSFVFSLLCVSHTHAIMIGSEFFTFAQSHIIFPASNHDNSVASFSWLKNGFSLEDATTTVTFNSIYPVSGLLNLNGGTLVLNTDLVLKDQVTLGSYGTIIGNGNNVDITRATFTPILPTGPRVFQDVNLYISGDFTVTTTFFFKGNCKVIGSNNSSFTLFDGIGFLIVEPGSTLALRNLDINNVQETNIRCIDDSGKISLDQCQILQSGHYSFSKGSMSFNDIIDWQGSFTFLYDSKQSSTIEMNSILHMFENINFALGRSSDSTFTEPLVFVDQTSILNMDNATLNITSHGAQFTKGTLQISNGVTVDINSTSSANAFVTGNGILADDLACVMDAASTLDFNTGIWVLNTVEPIFFQAPAGATLIREPASTFWFSQNRIHKNLTLIREPGQSLIFDPGITLFFDNSTIATRGIIQNSFTLSGFSPNGFENILSGNQGISINAGQMDYLTLVSNTGNIIGGSGSVANTITLTDSNTTLTWSLTGNLNAGMIMNGGSLTLTNDFNMANDLVLSGSSIIHICTFNFNTGYTDFTWDSPIYIDSLGGRFALNANTTLTNVWTFSGDCQLDLNGHILDITAGSLVVERGSTLEITDGTLRGIHDSNVRCLDNNALLDLDVITWAQDADFTFSTGSLMIENAVQFQGNAIFAYQSTLYLRDQD